MKKAMTFRIDEQSLDDLICEAESYEELRLKVRFASNSSKQAAEKLQTVDIAQMNTNMAILYHYYRNGTLNTAFSSYHDDDPDSDDPSLSSEEIYTVRWGNTARANKTMSLMCRMLSELSIDRIAETYEKTDLYHEITEFIDKSRRKHSAQYILNSPEFWTLVFRFHDLYYDLCGVMG